MIEVLKDNGRPEAGAVYAAIDMELGQVGRSDGAGSRLVNLH